MSDHNEGWWNAPGADSPRPPGENPDAARRDPDDAGDHAGANESPVADQPPPADATTVLPSSPAGAPPPPAEGQQPAHQPPGQALQPPPPPGQQPVPPQAYGQPQAYSQPPAYGGQQPVAPQYGNQPQAAPAYGQPPGQQPFAPQYGQVPGPAANKRSGGVTAGALIMLGGALLAAIGSLLPWLSFDGIEFGDAPNGFETYAFFGDDFDPILWTNPGAYILGAYVLVAVLAIIVLAAGKSTWTSVCGILAALIGGAISLAAIAAIADLVNTFRDLNVGAGIVLVGLATVVSFVGSLIVAIVR